MKIYTENQVSNYAHSVGEPGIGVEAKRVAAYGEEFNQSAEAYEKQARNTYSLSVNAQWQASINELANNPVYANDPVAMENKINSITDKMSSEIVDDDVKMNFLVNASLKGKSYVNRAIANHRKIQDEQAKSSLYDSIFAGIDSESVVLANGISGVGDSSDLANAVFSNDMITSAMNAKNPDGTFIFTDAQRKQMQKDREMTTFNSFKASFDDLPDYKRRVVYEKMKSDKMSLGMIKDEDGEEKEIYLQDVVSRDTYNKYKEFAHQREENEYLLEKRSIAKKEFEEKQAMYNQEQELSDKLDDLDPTEALKILEQNEGIVSDKYFKAKQKALLSAKGITADTRAERATDIILGISALQNIEDDEEYIKEADKLLTKIEDTYASGELSLVDKKSLSANVKKKIGAALPQFIDDKSHWWNKYSWKDAYEDVKETFPDEATSSKIFLDYFRTLNKSEKDYSEPERRNLIKTLVQQNLRQEFNYPRFNNLEEMRQAYSEGKIKKGDVIYVAGKRGKI